jgi:hypothetical protein
MMRWPQWVGPQDPFDVQWFNDVTQVILQMQTEISMMRSDLAELKQAISTQCHCGKQALIGDYLCADCRGNLTTTAIGTF